MWRVSKIVLVTQKYTLRYCKHSLRTFPTGAFAAAAEAAPVQLLFLVAFRVLDVVFVRSGSSEGDRVK
jgi:hypothetical protein